MPTPTCHNASGFSLVEVLLSLLLLSTLSFTLLQQHLQAKRLLSQWIKEGEASLILDNMEEALIARINPLPTASPPYHFQMSRDERGPYLEVRGYEGLIVKRRRYQT